MICYKLIFANGDFMNTEILSEMIIKKVISSSAVYTEEGKIVKRKDRPCWGIIYKFEGETVYYSKGKKYTSNSDNMVILPRGSSYDWQCVKGGRYRCIEFDSDLCFDEILTFSVNNKEKLLGHFESIEQKILLKKHAGSIELIRDVYSIIISALNSTERKYAPSLKQQKIYPAIEYIAKNYNKEIKNDDLASLIGISTVYFRKLFSEIYMTSPIAYIHSLRISKAKEMLLGEYGSITDIALSLGYANIYDFSRTFKRITGISPKKYVEKRKEEI